MIKPTIVINAAGRGSRLGMQIPKSLVQVGERRVLEWQLTEMCHPDDHIRIVVGYMGESVAELAQSLFPNIEVRFNRDWATTKTAASLSIGAVDAPGRVLSLDGDLLVHPDDFRTFLSATEDTLGVTSVDSSQPVYADVGTDGMCRRLTYEPVSTFEWTGLVNFDPSRTVPGTDHVFKMVECLLPARTMHIRCCEIDTPEDLKRAETYWTNCVQPTEVTSG